MKIEDITPADEKLYCQCLEDWSDDMKESGDHKERWYCLMKNQGLRVKLAKDDDGNVAGMIQYAPIENSPAEGNGLYFVYCIWVHGHKQGRGNFQKKGYGKALLSVAEEDVKNLGGKGIAAWGLMLPFWMKASWFKKQGYKSADRMGIQVLLWKPFTNDATLPKWIRRKKKPEAGAEKVQVTAFHNGWCPAQNIVFERAKRAAAEYRDRVIFMEYDTSDRAVFLEWGISDAVFIDGKEVWSGPPPSYEKIKGLIEKRIKKKRL